MNTTFIIGNRFLVNPASNEIYDRARTDTPALKMEQMLVQVLLLLSETPNEVIPRQRFIDRIWQGDKNVGEPALTKAIYKLRKILQADAPTSIFIETIPKKGYRLNAHIDAQVTQTLIHPQSIKSPLEHTIKMAMLIGVTLLLVALVLKAVLPHPVWHLFAH